MKWLIGFFLLGLMTGAHIHDHQHLIGTKAPELTIESWLNVDKDWEQQSTFQNKVLLIRWWTGPFCPFCRNSAAALQTWQHRYQNQDFQVIGLYHHKSRQPFSMEDIDTLGEELGYDFPIGIDKRWENLKQWWLDRVPDAGFTSVSFLVDRHGIIRYIHPGGEYVKGDGQYEELEEAIEKVLRE
ncbi:MAG: TlpA disulfide reductase family protein [Bacteroidota bacterium]